MRQEYRLIGPFSAISYRIRENGRSFSGLFVLVAVQEESKQAGRLDSGIALALQSSMPLYWYETQHRCPFCAGFNVPGRVRSRLHAAHERAKGAFGGGYRFFNSRACFWCPTVQGRSREVTRFLIAIVCSMPAWVQR